nr:CHASE2 domain-containing protein [Crocosphaera sp.]
MITKLHQVIRSFLVDKNNEPSSQDPEKLPLNSKQPVPRPWQQRWFFYLPSLLLSSLLVTGGIIALRQTGSLQFLELVAYDHMVRLNSQPVSDSRLLIVGINEADIKYHQRLPLPDQVIAQVLNQLQRYDPKLIALDIYRDMPYPPGTEALQESLKRENIIVVNELPRSQEKPRVSAPKNIPKHRVGFSDLAIDPDNVVRRTFLYVETPSGKTKEYSFALQTVLNYLDKENNLSFEVAPDHLKINSHQFSRLQKNSGGYILPESETLGWQILVDYRSENIAPVISLNDVIEGNFDPSWVKDKIVLMGVTSPTEKDTFPSPYSATATDNFEMAGVEIHGQIISQ